MDRQFITFNAKITPVQQINDEFTLCKAYICALGKNRNFSYIGKEAADEALYSLYNIPVVGHLYQGEDGSMHMGGHDAVLEVAKDGSISFKSLCVPYGVVQVQDDIHYEDIKEPNGDVKTYIVGECILWTGRYPELMDAIYSDDIYFSQSMEINVDDYVPLEEDKNYTNITKFRYSALCLLGKSDDKNYDVVPCFPEAKIEAYSVTQCEQFSELMNQFKIDLSNCMEKYGQTGKEEGNQMTEEQINAISAEYEVTVEELDFEITETMTEEEFRSLVEDFAKRKKKCCDGDGDGSTEQEYAFTYREIAAALGNAMPNSKAVYYWVCDFDDKYVYVERTTYSENGDYTEEKGRFEYIYNKEEKSATLNGDFEKMVVRWLTEEEDAQLDAIRAQYEILSEYKAEREKADREKEFDSVLNEFHDLVGNEEFDAVVENKYSYDSASALKDACYIIRGKFSILQQHKKNDEHSVPIVTPKAELSLREKLHEQFGKKH